MVYIFQKFADQQLILPDRISKENREKKVSAFRKFANSRLVGAPP